MSKHKIIELNNKITALEDVTQKETVKQDQLNETLRIRSTYHYFDQLTNLSTEWVSLDEPDEFGIYDLYKNWEFQWESIDIRLLPFINCEILYRRKNGEEPSEYLGIPQISKIFEIVDNGDESPTQSDYYKAIRLICSIHFITFERLYEYETKLVLFINNIRNYK